MKFKIESTYLSVDRLIGEYSCLKDFNFVVEPSVKMVHTWIRDENGKKIWTEAPKPTTVAYVEIKDLDDLLKLSAAVGHCVIIGPDIDSGIEIYDGYRE